MSIRLRTVRPKLKINRTRVSALANFLYMLAASAETSPIRQYEEITLLLTGDAYITDVHESTMDIPETTDVVTVFYPPLPGIPGNAEIFVNVQLAARNDRSTGELLSSEITQAWSPHLELALYIAHGFDHLNDNDDHTTRGFQSMRKRELGWLLKAQEAGLVSNLFQFPDEDVQ